METLIETIRVAVAPDATEEQRAAGAAACRTIGTALESKPSEALMPALPHTVPQLAQMISVLRGVPPEQLLDLAIARLQAALPAGDVATPSGPALRFHLLPIAAFGGGK